MPVNKDDDHTVETEKVDGIHLSTMLILLLLCGAFWVAVCGGIFHFLS